MEQKSVYTLNELNWQPLRADSTKGIFGKSLIPEHAKNFTITLTKVEREGEFFLHKDSYGHILYFLEGEGEGTLRDEHYRIIPGTITEVRAGELHGYRNTGTKEMMLITVNVYS